jgi:SAM-dependent methyltransferase
MDERRAMREGWNERARRDAFRYVETEHWDGDVDAFFALGEERCRLLVDPVLAARGIDGRGATVLDLGCGVGRITRALADRFATTVGVDVSDEMIRRAQELHPPAEYPNLRFADSDGVRLPLDAESVDFIFSYEVLQHMPSHEVILSNVADMRRVLRRDGLALVHVHTAPSLAVLARSRLLSSLPTSLVHTLKTRVLRQDPLVADTSFRGSPPLRRKEIGPMFESAGLVVDELRDDPTHVPGARVFVVARRG